MELGSEYHLNLDELSECGDNVFSYLNEYNCVYTDSGRSAIRLLSKNMKGRILMPEYICESVINCFDLEKIVFF